MCTSSHDADRPRRLRSLLGNNFLGTLALIVACSGTAYAAARIGSADIIDNSIQSVDVKDGALKQRDLAPARWRKVKAAPPATDNCAAGETAVFCVNADSAFWYNYADGFQEARFRKDLTGEVHLQGLVLHYWGGAIAQKDVFVLPKAYRPTASLIFSVACGAASPPFDRAGAVQVDPDGRVSWRGEDGCSLDHWLSLTGISFPAA